MAFRFASPLIEGVIKSRPNRFIMNVEVEGNLHVCHCPVTGKIDGEKRKTAYTVEAISIQEATPKKWVGINQNAANRYIEHMLKTGQIPQLATVEQNVRREKSLGDSRIDFLVGDSTYIEVKTPLVSLTSDDSTNEVYKRKFAPQFFERTIRHFAELRKNLKKQKKDNPNAKAARINVYEAKQFVPPPMDKTNKEIIECVRKATKVGVEMWQVNLLLDENGVSMSKIMKLELGATNNDETKNNAKNETKETKITKTKQSKKTKETKTKETKKKTTKRASTDETTNTKKKVKK